MKIDGRYLAIAFSLGAVLILILLTRHDTEQTAAREVVVAQDAPARANGTRPGRGVGAGVFSDDEIKGAEELSKAAERGGDDLVPRAREWAGTNVTRKIWACDIARNAKRTDALAVLARDALEACRGGGATYGRLFRIAKFLEECRDWAAARAALDAAAPLEPGFRKVAIRPQLGGLKRLSATVPTVAGPVTVKVENGTLEYSSPTPAVVDFAGEIRKR